MLGDALSLGIPFGHDEENPFKLLLMRLHFLFHPQANREHYGQSLQALYPPCPIEQCDVIVVLGGDGSMLHALRKYATLKKPFYGIHFGRQGVLMHPHGDPTQLLADIEKTTVFTLYPLKFLAQTENEEELKGWAFNEVCLQRAQYRPLQFQVKVNETIVIESGSGDGVILATPMGSRAYNASAGGATVSLLIPAMVLTPLASYSPKGWSSCVLPFSSTIEIHTLESRLGLLGADVIQYPGVKRVTLAYDLFLPVRLHLPSFLC